MVPRRRRCFKALSRMSSFPTYVKSMQALHAAEGFQSAVAHELISNKLNVLIEDQELHVSKRCRA